MPHWILAGAASSSSPFQSVTDFFSSSTWHFVTLMFYFLFVVMWFACAYWVFDDKIILAVCILTGLVFGPLGLIVYAIVRPAELLADRREQQLELQMMEQRLGEESRCSFCKTTVRDDYLVCPTCGRRLRTTCASCGKPIEPNWRVCPYCEADVHGAMPSASVYDRA